MDPMTYHNLLERRLRILANSGYVDEMRTFLQSTYNVDQLVNRHDNKGVFVGACFEDTETCILLLSVRRILTVPARAPQETTGFLHTRDAY